MSRCQLSRCGLPDLRPPVNEDQDETKLAIVDESFYHNLDPACTIDEHEASSILTMVSADVVTDLIETYSSSTRANLHLPPVIIGYNDNVLYYIQYLQGY